MGGGEAPRASVEVVAAYSGDAGGWSGVGGWGNAKRAREEPDEDERPQDSRRVRRQPSAEATWDMQAEDAACRGTLVTSSAIEEDL